MFKKKPCSMSRTEKLLVVTTLMLIGLFISSVGASTLTSLGQVKPPFKDNIDVWFVAGPDSTGSTKNPRSSVFIAPTHNYARITSTMFPSEINNPQPATYYTNLLQITNFGSLPYQIYSVEITDLLGMANLGGMTIYYYATQTNNPQSGTPIGSVTLTSTSLGTYVFSGFPMTLDAGATNYIEIVEYASPTAVPGATVGFTIRLQFERHQNR